MTHEHDPQINVDGNGGYLYTKCRDCGVTLDDDAALTPAQKGARTRAANKAAAEAAAEEAAD